MNARYDQFDDILDIATQVHRSGLRLFRLLRATRPANGLSSSKLSVLGFLYQGGEGTATELASYLRIQPQSLTRLIADLERSKLITRRTNNEDRRQSLLEITEAGRRLLIQEIRGQRVILSQTMEKELTTSEQELLRISADLMDRIAEVIEERIVSPGKKKQNKDHEENFR